MRRVNFAGGLGFGLTTPTCEYSPHQGSLLASCYPVHTGLALECLHENKSSSLTYKSAAYVSCRSTIAITLAGKDLKDSSPAGKEMWADADADPSGWGKSREREGLRDRHDVHPFGGSMACISAVSLTRTHLYAC